MEEITEKPTPQEEIGEIDLVLIEGVLHLQEQTDKEEIDASLVEIDGLLDERLEFMKELGWTPENTLT